MPFYGRSEFIRELVFLGSCPSRTARFVHQLTSVKRKLLSFRASGAQFRDKTTTAMFESMEVGGTAFFDETKFSGPVSLSHAIFSGPVSFYWPRLLVIYGS